MKKELKESAKDREIYALRHQISSKDKQNKILNDELKISHARTQTQAVLNGYLIDRYSSGEDVKIKTLELAEYITAGKEAIWQEENGVITIKTVKKD